MWILCIDFKRRYICLISVFLLYHATLKHLFPSEKKSEKTRLKRKLNRVQSMWKASKPFSCKLFSVTCKPFKVSVKAFSVLSKLFSVSCNPSFKSERAARVQQACGLLVRFKVCISHIYLHSYRNPNYICLSSIYLQTRKTRKQLYSIQCCKKRFRWTVCSVLFIY